MRERIRRRRIVVLPLLATGTLLASAGTAAAEPGPPGVWAATAQYVEMIPTSTGPKAAGAGGPTKPLPKSLATQFARRGGTDAKALETLVTSSGWGASTTPRAAKANEGTGTREGTKEGASAGTLVVPLPQESISVPESVGDALADSRRANFALVALLLLLTAFTLARLVRSPR
jgi:hypothetical protein